MNKPREKDFVNYVVTGSRYQVMNEKGEPTSEFGEGVFRAGIQLRLASALYLQLVDKQGGGSPWNGEAKRMAKAAEFAASAFALSEVFLEEMDKHFRTPPPPPPENDGAKRR